jgi:hypothetical protein
MFHVEHGFIRSFGTIARVGSTRHYTPALVDAETIAGERLRCERFPLAHLADLASSEKHACRRGTYLG